LRFRHRQFEMSSSGCRRANFLRHGAISGALAKLAPPARIRGRARYRGSGRCAWRGWSATLWRILAQRLKRKRHRMALENLSVAFPEKSGSERLAICLAHWENLGRVIVETVQIDRLLADPSCIDLPDRHLLARYGNKLGPAIGVSLHMGNWELAIWPFVVAGANPAALYRAIDNPYVDAYLRAKRQTLYPAGLIGRRRADASPSHDLRTAHRLMQHVRGGGRVGIICDQSYRRGIPVRFFGRTMLAQPIAAIMARRLGSRV